MKSRLTHFARGALLCFGLGVAAVTEAGMAIIAHPGNPQPGITADEAARIYLGKTTSFPNGRAAVPVDQAPASAARIKFYKSVVKKDDTEYRSYWAKLQFSGKGQPPRELADDQAIKAFVAGNPNAIGYVDGKFVDGTVKVLLIIP